MSIVDFEQGIMHGLQKAQKVIDMHPKSTHSVLIELLGRMVKELQDSPEAEKTDRRLKLDKHYDMILGMLTDECSRASIARACEVEYKTLQRYLERRIPDWKDYYTKLEEIE